MSAKSRVLIIPLGSLDTILLERVSEHLRNLGFDVYVSVWPLNVPLVYFDWERLQFRADEVLNYVIERVGSIDGFEAIIAVGYLDAYTDGLNFVFGLSRRKYGTVYIKRLFDEDLNRFVSRVIKEVTHELGHALGLGHCETPGCVMNFSNSVSEVDEKSAFFCDSCRAKIGLYSKQRV